MNKLFLILAFLFAFTASAYSADIDVGAVSSIPGFNTANAGADTPLSNVSVTLGSPNVTCTNCLPTGAVGVGGMQITFSTGVRYTIATVASRSAFTLTVNYAESTGTVTATLHKFVHLRIYATSSFIPGGSSVVVQAGTPGSSAWYRRYGVSIVNDGSQNIAHFPQINDLPATTDSSVPTARYFAALYTQSGGFIQGYPGCVDEFRLSHLTTPTSWAQICTFNTPPISPPPQPTNFLTEAQINARFPSCLINNLDFFAATGNVKSCLTLSGEFSIAGGVLSLAAPATGYNRIQEEGVNLPQRATLNFIGSAFTAADEVGVRTNITADADLNALASNATNGFWAAGTNIARTLTGTANEIAITNGNGTIGNPVWSLPAALTFTGKTVTGGIYAGITGFGIRSTGGGAFDLQFNNTETLTANRALTFTLNDAARTINLGGNLVTASSFTTAGANALTLTTTGSTNVTLPTTGTLATLAGTETFTNKTLTSPRIGTSVLDTNGNELLSLTATGSAVNEVSLANAATGNGPTIGVSGGDTNANLNINAKGTGRVVIKGYPFTLEVNTTTAGNVGAGLDNLHSFNLPADSLASNGDYLHLRYTGSFANTEANKQTAVLFGGQFISSFSVTVDLENGAWAYDIYVVRESATTVRASVIATLVQLRMADGALVTTPSGGFTFAQNNLVTVSNLNSNAQTIVVQGEGTADNDVVQNQSIIKLVQRQQMFGIILLIAVQFVWRRRRSKLRT